MQSVVTGFNNGVIATCPDASSVVVSSSMPPSSVSESSPSQDIGRGAVAAVVAVVVVAAAKLDERFDRKLTCALCSMFDSSVSDSSSDCSIFGTDIRMLPLLAPLLL